ncbi:hypothetical protein ACLNGM_09430 [Aureimonas phyllosphaerae]|uniref:hypothetical protein n=1 Tax=Aureimonas phyllosphaerae TaxID=1166078 RepID=UPI003A5C37DE
MPNLKIFVDETIFPDCRTALDRELESIRSMLCRELGVEVAACQFAVLPVMALPDQPSVNVEMQIMPKPDRTRERLVGLAETLRDAVGYATHAPVAVRISTLDPSGYVTLK